MITLNDLITRFNKDNELAELTDRDNYADIDVTVVNTAIQDAEGIVESYLNAVGLVKRSLDGELLYIASATVPEVLQSKTCDIARWYLHDDQVTSEVQKRYDEAIKWFERVQKNPAMLTGIDDKNGNTDGINSGIAVMANPTPNMWKI